VAEKDQPTGPDSSSLEPNITGTSADGDLNFDDPQAWTDADWDQWTAQLPDRWWSGIYFDAGGEGSATLKGLLYDRITEASWIGDFSRLAQLTKLAFFDAWYETHEKPRTTDRGADAPASIVDSEQYFTTITLPDGSTVVETQNESGVISRELFDHDANAVRELEVDDDPLDEAAAMRASKILRTQARERRNTDEFVVGAGGGVHILGLPISKKLIAIVAAAAAATAVVAVAVSGGGDGDSTAPANSGGDVGGASTASAGAGAGAVVTASSGGRTRPVVIDLCAAGGDPISAMGLSIPVSEGQFNEDAGFAFCNWESDAGGISATISRTSNAVAAQTAWAETFDADADSIFIPWSPEGEIRIRDSSAGQSAWLWAYIIDTDYVNRDIYLEVHVTAGLDTNGQSVFPELLGQQEALFALGEVLSDAARAGQPEGVILPDVILSE